MEGKAVDAIAELTTRSQNIEIDGVQYVRDGSGNWQEIGEAKFYRPHSLHGQTLSGLMDFLIANIDGFDLDNLTIIVNSFDHVVLFDKLDGFDNKRSILFESKLDPSLPKFKFEQYMPIEEFIIRTRALFQSTDDLDEIISIVSRVTNQNEIKLDDNGISQDIAVRRGVSGATKDTVQTRGVYSLAPYRTFRELKQPVSKFILRMKAGGENELPTIALFDAEGETWRYTAVLDIRDFLREKLDDTGVTVIA